MSDNYHCDGSSNANVIVIEDDCIITIKDDEPRKEVIVIEDEEPRAQVVIKQEEEDDTSVKITIKVKEDEEPPLKRAKIEESIRRLSALEPSVEGTSFGALVPTEKVVPGKETLKDVYRFLFGENKLENKKYYKIPQGKYRYHLETTETCCKHMSYSIKAMVTRFENNLSLVAYDYAHCEYPDYEKHIDYMGIKMEYAVACYQGQTQTTSTLPPIPAIYVEPWLYVSFYDKDQTVLVEVSCDRFCLSSDKKHFETSKGIIQTNFPPFPPSTDRVRWFFERFWSFCEELSRITSFHTEMDCNDRVVDLFESVFGAENCKQLYMSS